MSTKLPSPVNDLCALNASVQVVRDDFSAVSKNECYASSREEKMMRAALKSHVERHLNSGVLHCLYTCLGALQCSPALHSLADYLEVGQSVASDTLAVLS